MKGNTVVGRIAPTDDLERQRWERLRRALLNIISQMQDAGGRYTLDVRIVHREQTEQTTR